MKTNTNNEYSEIAAELKKRLEGDIHFDQYSRLLYSTDASIYQIEPIGVVVPRHKGDVQAVIEIANSFKCRCCLAAAALPLRGRPWATPSCWTFRSTCRTFWR